MHEPGLSSVPVHYDRRPSLPVHGTRSGLNLSRYSFKKMQTSRGTGPGTGTLGSRLVGRPPEAVTQAMVGRVYQRSVAECGLRSGRGVGAPRSRIPRDYDLKPRGTSTFEAMIQVRIAPRTTP